jgi:hypothetical protein
MRLEIGGDVGGVMLASETAAPLSRPLPIPAGAEAAGPAVRRQAATGTAQAIKTG